jgi:hypothetical protein
MPIPNRIRYFNKRFLNRLTIKIAGASHSPIALVQTPVMVKPLEDGFMFALTYGPAVDWYRNVLASGSCTLLWHGGKYQLEDPQSVPTKTGLHAFPPPFRQILMAIRIEHFFKMKFAAPDPAAERS